MDNLRLYHKMLPQLCQWLPGERITRLRNLALLMVGLYLERSVHLSYIVRQWPLSGKAPSLTHRLHRFLDNAFVVPHRYFEPLAATLLRRLSHQPLRLVIDTTQVGFSHRALLVGVAYRRRVIPLTWSVHRGVTGSVTVHKQVALLRRVYALIPSGSEVSLVGDSGFKSSDLLYTLREWRWSFVVRQPGKTKVRPLQSGIWTYLGDLPLAPGQTCAVGWVWLARTNPFGPVWLVLHWAPGEKEPWFLVSDQDDTRQVLRDYRRRMWIEETYGDMKGHGFDLERTHLRQAARIERLMLGICLAYVWFIALASWVVKRGYRHFIDRKDRRDLSYFRLGWDWLARCLRLGQPIRLCFVPYV